MYQSITILGNLGHDPEINYMTNGTAVTKLNVATNRKYTGNDGQEVKETTWFRVAVFGKQAEACAQYLKKGSQVLVDGRLSPDPATGSPKVFAKKDGTWGASFEIVANTVRFVGTPAEGVNKPAPVKQNAGMDVGEEEIPF